MTDITSSDSISSVMELANNVVDSGPAENFMTMVKQKFSENKMYVYIGIAVIILGVVLYYFYVRNKKETKKSDNKPVLELPKQEKPNVTEKPDNYNQVPQISGDEYWVMDANGKPVKVSGAFGQVAPLPIPKQAPSAAEIKMLQQQMLEQQMIQQQMMHQQMMQEQFEREQREQHQRQLAEKKAANANKKPHKKITHPEDSEAKESDDIDVELARIKANEDENVAQHDLTNSELAEIKNKLEIMGSQLGAN